MHIPRVAFGLSLCALCFDLSVLVANAPSNIFGFSSSSAIVERSVESRFLASPSPDRARSAHAFLTSEPHVAGSPRDHLLAEWVRDRWREYGLEQVDIVQHDVLLSTASDVAVEMPPAPTRPAWRATLDEGGLLAYHAYSRSGDVTAPVVYANGGNPEDYDWLSARGVEVKGRIALVRYSMPYSYRGFKALTAEQRGAAGLLIYSDPAEDGGARGATYPDGPWGPEDHLQRGAIVYDFRVPGDPLTPGWPSIDGARRIPRGDAVSLPKIVSAPLSARDAKTILAAMAGPDAPATWRGGLPIRYRVGDATTRVRLRVQMDERVRPIWTVVGRITGTMAPEQQVIVGNHRDAWAYGGVDPSTGTAALMELARAFGSLAKQGTRPKRTIVFANWDAEEFTLTSSTEWGEQHEDALRANAVAYLNVDSAASGPDLKLIATPALNRVVTEAARDVANLAASEHDIVDNRLGSGSDYTVFLNHLGVPVADLSYTGVYGVYHSTYDNHDWVSRFGDPGFRRHAALARLWGTVALRLANADVVPLDYRPTASRIREFIRDAAARAPEPDRRAFEPLGAAIDRLARAAGEVGSRIDALLAAARPEATRSAAMTSALIAAERGFLSERGLPGRPWYRHLLYAPKPSYAPELLPAITEALDDGDRARLGEQVASLVAALERVSTTLESAAK